MTKKRTGKAEREHYAKLVLLGCVICQRDPEIHHLLAGKGMGQKSKSAIPLCHVHHRTGGPGVAIHAGVKTWEAKYGTEAYFLGLVREALNVGSG